MPVYEYYCLDCRKVFEALRPMSQANEPIRCRACESAKTRRSLSLFAAQTASDGEGYRALGGGCACGGACTCGPSHH